ncbi:MAG: hypothetical protein MUD08_06840 [Cytophagales bacterium]|jgi:hypothetical protein|nr:hypothetical protein [Cytophagales bacterium]
MKIAYTISTANYLAFAKSVADSVVEHNPEYTYVIVLLDRINGRFDKDFFNPHQLMEVEQMGIAEFAEMNEKYTVFELSNALKPFVTEYLMNQHPNASILVQLDSDMLAFGRFTHVESVLQEHAVAITPHILTPLPEDGQHPTESNFFVSGIFNAGFVAMNTSDNARRFVQWWKTMLKDRCYDKPRKGLFVDQIWLNIASVFFDKVHIVKHFGYNVAAHNLHERQISFRAGAYRVNDNEELAVYHYTGFDYRNPSVLSKFQSRFTFENRPDLKPLFDVWMQRLEANRMEQFSKMKYLSAPPRTLWQRLFGKKRR